MRGDIDSMLRILELRMQALTLAGQVRIPNPAPGRVLKTFGLCAIVLLEEAVVPFRPGLPSRRSQTSIGSESATPSRVAQLHASGPQSGPFLRTMFTGLLAYHLGVHFLVNSGLKQRFLLPLSPLLQILLHVAPSVLFVALPFNVFSFQLLETLPDAAEGLAMLGSPLPMLDNEIEAAIPGEHAQLEQALSQIDSDTLAALPDMTDSHTLAVIRLMDRVMMAGYCAGRVRLIHLITLRMLALVLEGGHSPLACLALPLYANFFLIRLKEYDRGHELSKVALRVMDRFADQTRRGQFNVAMATSVVHWKGTFDVSPVSFEVLTCERPFLGRLLCPVLTCRSLPAASVTCLDVAR